MIVEPSTLGYSELVELYGEELGFSLTKAAKSVGRAAKSVAKPVARTVVKAAGVVARNPATIATGGALLLAPKSVQKTANSATRIATTGGASLLVSKQDRNTVGKTARVTQSAVLRPTAHVAANVARNPLVQKATLTAARGVAAAYTGGASEAAIRSASLLKSKAKAVKALAAPKKRAPAPMAPKTILPSPKLRAAVGSFGMRRPEAATPAAAIREAFDKPVGSNLPILPIALGGLGLLGVLALSMGRRNA